MRIVFMGSPDFAVPSLEALIQAGHDIVLCVCQADKASGRGRKLKSCAVKARALELGLDVATPDKVRGKSARPFIDQVEALQPDFLVVAAYGKILSTRLLKIPRYGAINVHASLLPRWRGAAPIQHAILAGDDESGVSIMRMEAGLDTGAVFHVEKTPIADDDTGGSLFDRLAQIGAKALVESLPTIASGELHAQQQDERLASYAPTLNKEDGHLDFRHSATSLERRVRAMQPWPSAWCLLPNKQKSKRLKVLKVRALKDQECAQQEILLPDQNGQVLQLKHRLLVRCDEGLLDLLRVQPEGRKAMKINDFLSGAHLPEHLVLE